MAYSTLVIILTISLTTVATQLVIPKPVTELYLIRLRIEMLIQEVYEKCPDLVDHRAFLGKRDLRGLHSHTMKMERKIFQHMQQLFAECYSDVTTGGVTSIISASTEPQTPSETTAIFKTTESTTTRSTPITTAPTSTTATTTTATTTPKPATTSIPLPVQCTSSATLNLTESWRNNYSDTDLRYDDIKILLPGVTWIRFTGAAGNLLRNSCPPSGYSCGSIGGYWSDSPLPTRVGETVNITFYEKWIAGSCDDNSGAQTGRATRCSADRGGDVYIMDVAVDTEDDAVCGMD